MVKSDFSIGHRGAAMQYPEHTFDSYKAGALQGAGIIECDVTFTKDKELVCRHSQCDLHTTTDVVTRPEMNAKCTVPFEAGSGVSPNCCTSDFTLEELKTLCAKMDSNGGVNATSAEAYVSFCRLHMLPSSHVIFITCTFILSTNTLLFT